jgi:hypothetical protein
MYETADDLAALQQLLDASHAHAGPHLAGIMSHERRLDARGVADRLRGVCILHLATVTDDGRPLVGPVDGLFYRGQWHFGTSPDAVRLRHIRARPAVSGSYTVGEEFAVAVHGEAHEIDLHAPEHAGYRAYLLETYTPRYGDDWEAFMDAAAALRITAHKMFNFWNPLDASAADIP